MHRTKGLNQAEQMFVIQAYKQEHDYMDSDDEVTFIDPDELKGLKKQAKKEQREARA